MNLHKAFLAVSLALTVMLALIGGVTFGALQAFNQASAAARDRQNSLALMNDVRHEVDLLGRLVSSYVATADPRFLIYYYDILGIREGTKPRPAALPPSYWEQVIAGSRAYVPPVNGRPQPLSARVGQLGFDAGEKAVVGRFLDIAEKMKGVEQIAFAATQGLYDPEKQKFVSEAVPSRQYAGALLHQPRYLKLRADLALSIDELSRLVDQRTAGNLAQASVALHRWIVAALFLLCGAVIVLLVSYQYLRRHLLNPLSKLHRVATALAGKAFGARVGNVDGVEEVQALANTLDTMAGAIEDDLLRREAAEQALREARARAEVATEAKSLFLANMSHEIRTPMNAILGMAYLALKSGLPPRQEDYVNKIHTAARSLLGIINDILDFSKIEAGKLTLEHAPFEVMGVVENALFMIQQRAEGKHVELLLDCRLPADFPSLSGDSLRLGQVLINLLSNAVKFTEAGHVRLTVEEDARDASASLLRFCVEDTGIGMSQEQIGHLFQEFSQADGSTTRKYGGTGLGLSISKRLVDAMGGAIKVESTIGRGSRFSFSVALPLAGPAVPESEPMGAARRALVVDDYAATRQSLAEMLHLAGCRQVEQAAGGSDALARLQAARAEGAPFDLMLLDWAMPGMSGEELLKAMSACAIPLPERTVVVSASDASLLRGEAGRYGVTEVIQKPLMPHMLRRIGRAGGEGKGAPAGAAEAERRLHGVRILVVDDNEINRQIAGELLGCWGAAVDVAADGGEALDRVFGRPPGTYSAILMDLEMPVMDGREATRRLRADERYATLPIIAMTAHAIGGDLPRALALGMNAYIAKPFDPEQLLATLASCLQVRREPGAAAGETPGNGGDEAFLDALADIREIDPAALVHRFAGRIASLRRLLRSFAQRSGELVAEIRGALARGDLDGARRGVHTLKGLAGTFEMKNLRQAALGLEEAIKAGGVEPAAEIGAVEKILAAVLGQLAGLPAEPANASAPPGMERASEVLERFRGCLRESDSAAAEIWNRRRSELAGLFSVVQLATLERAMADWDFEAALAVLATIPHDESMPR